MWNVAKECDSAHTRSGEASPRQAYFRHITDARPDMLINGSNKLVGCCNIFNSMLTVNLITIPVIIITVEFCIFYYRKYWIVN